LPRLVACEPLIERREIHFNLVAMAIARRSLLSASWNAPDAACAAARIFKRRRVVVHLAHYVLDQFLCAWRMRVIPSIAEHSSGHRHA